MKNEKSRRSQGSLALWRFRSAERRWRASLLRSTATGQGGVRRRLDSRDTLLKQRTTKQENKGHRVTPLLAQRITLPGNSYFWRTARGRPKSEGRNPKEGRNPNSEEEENANCRERNDVATEPELFRIS